MGRLTLKVAPGASKTDIQFEPTQPSMGAPRAPVAFRVRLTSPPIEGRANEALEGLLSELSGTPVRIVAGQKGRIKTIEFAADPASFVEAVQRAWEQGKGKRRK